MKQWAVERGIRLAVKEMFDRSGVPYPYPRVVTVPHEKPGELVSREDIFVAPDSKAKMPAKMPARRRQTLPLGRGGPGRTGGLMENPSVLFFAQNRLSLCRQADGVLLLIVVAQQRPLRLRSPLKIISAAGSSISFCTARRAGRAP